MRVEGKLALKCSECKTFCQNLTDVTISDTYSDSGRKGLSSPFQKKVRL